MAPSPCVGVMLHYVPPCLRLVSLFELGMLIFRMADTGTPWGWSCPPHVATSVDSALRGASHIYRFYAF